MTRRQEPLSSVLLDKIVYAKPEYVGGLNERLWTGLKPRDGKLTGRIIAAWIDEGHVKIAVVDTHGNTGEFYLTSVNLKEKTE